MNAIASLRAWRRAWRDYFYYLSGEVGHSTCMYCSPWVDLKAISERTQMLGRASTTMGRVIWRHKGRNAETRLRAIRQAAN